MFSNKSLSSKDFHYVSDTMHRSDLSSSNSPQLHRLGKSWFDPRDDTLYSGLALTLTLSLSAGEKGFQGWPKLIVYIQA